MSVITRSGNEVLVTLTTDKTTSPPFAFKTFSYGLLHFPTGFGASTVTPYSVPARNEGNRKIEALGNSESAVGHPLFDNDGNQLVINVPSTLPSAVPLPVELFGANDVVLVADADPVNPVWVTFKS